MNNNHGGSWEPINKEQNMSDTGLWFTFSIILDESETVRGVATDGSGLMTRNKQGTIWKCDAEKCLIYTKYK